MPTKIEWAEEVWNPVTGCTKVSEGCKNCYAERMAKRLAGRFGYPKDDPFRVTLHPERLETPLRWEKPRMIFVCSMGDLFHPDVPLEFIAEVFDIMACATPDCGKRHRHTEECWAGDPHTFLILTKRPHRMKQVLEELPRWTSWHWPGDRPLSVALETRDWPLPNVWLGVTAENQKMADQRIPILLQVPAAVRFVSCEPLLGPVDLSKWFNSSVYCCACGQVLLDEGQWECTNCGDPRIRSPRNGLDWVICGGESGPGARPMHPDWVRSLRDQCQAAGVPFFFKQWGEWLHDTQNPPVGDGMRVRIWPDESFSWRVGKKRAGRLLDGRVWDQYPKRF